MRRAGVAFMLCGLAAFVVRVAPVSASGSSLGITVACLGNNVGVYYPPSSGITFNTSPSISVLKQGSGFIKFKGPFSGTITGTKVNAPSGSISQTFSVSCGVAGSIPPEIQDGRANDGYDDIAAPVVVYLKNGFVEIYAVDPATSHGVLWKKEPFASLLKFRVRTPPKPGLSGASPTTGRNISVYRLKGRRFQINTFYADGKEYVFRFKLPST